MITKEKIDYFLSIVQTEITQTRFEHSIRVAEISSKLAENFQIDTKSAYLAGVLHDITKQKTKAFHLEIFTKNNFSFDDLPEEAYHPFSAFFYLQEKYGFRELEILNAVRNHTLGGVNLPILDKILYVADFLGSEYAFRNPKLKEWLEKTSEDLYYGILLKSGSTITELSGRWKPIHSLTFHMYTDAIGKVSI